MHSVRGEAFRLRRSCAGEKVDDQADHRKEKQQMDQPARYVKQQKAACPQNEQQ